MNAKQYSNIRKELLKSLKSAGVENPAEVFPAVREHTDETLTEVQRDEQIDRMRSTLIDAENQREWNKVNHP